MEKIAWRMNMRIEPAQQQRKVFLLPYMSLRAGMVKAPVTAPMK